MRCETRAFDSQVCAKDVTSTRHLSPAEREVSLLKWCVERVVRNHIGRDVPEHGIALVATGANPRTGR